MKLEFSQFSFVSDTCFVFVSFRLGGGRNHIRPPSLSTRRRSKNQTIPHVRAGIQSVNVFSTFPPMHIELPFCFFFPLIFSKPSFIIIIISPPPPSNALLLTAFTKEENGRKMYTHTHTEREQKADRSVTLPIECDVRILLFFSFHLQLIYSPTVTTRDGERQGGGKSGRVRVACR